MGENIFENPPTRQNLRENHEGWVDEIGGTKKHAVYRHVLSKQVVTESTSHFAKYANSIYKGINILLVEILNLTYYDECRANAQYIDGTLKVKSVE